MKSFQAVIIAALAVSTAAINEPVPPPSAAIERELGEYERASLKPTMPVTPKPVTPKPVTPKPVTPRPMDPPAPAPNTKSRKSPKSAKRDRGLNEERELAEAEYERELRELAEYERELRELAEYERQIGTGVSAAQYEVPRPLSPASTTKSRESKRKLAVTPKPVTPKPVTPKPVTPRPVTPPAPNTKSRKSPKVIKRDRGLNEERELAEAEYERELSEFINMFVF